MKRSSATPVFIAVLAVIAGAAAIVALFALRFAQGDVYPEYSSLRADPLGTKVLHDSLSRMPGFVVSRSYRPLDDVASADAAILYFGASCWALSARSGQYRAQFRRAAERGNRIVLVFAPLVRAPQEKSALEAKPWNLRIMQDRDKDGRGPLWFADSKDWNVLRRENEKAVLIERRYGSGSIVLASSTTPFLNQAMAQARHTALILGAIGPGRRIVFDESHLGIAESGTIVGLARKYRLHGLFAGLLLLAVLWVWKSAAAFPPPRELPMQTAAVAGRDSLSGFVNLLRRNLPPKTLLELGWKEWKHSRGANLPAHDAAAVESILQSETDALAAYRRCQAYLAENKRIGKTTRV